MLFIHWIQEKKPIIYILSIGCVLIKRAEKDTTAQKNGCAQERYKWCSWFILWVM